MKDYVELDRANFQASIDGKAVDLYTLRNARGMVVKVTNYGAKVQQILVPDRRGRLGDVVLGYESIDQAKNGQASLNAFVGRYAGRIAGGRFTLDGVTHQLNLNSGPNTLHGGQKGSRFVVFDARQIDDSALELRYVYQDGEENFPGTLDSRLIYRATEDNALEIAYEAVAVDKATIVNFTHHMFFNLAGAGNGDILGHLLTIESDTITPLDASLIPTGEFRTIAGTPMDFTKPTAMGARIAADYDQLKFGSGYDVNYVLANRGDDSVAVARVFEPQSGRVLDVFTSEPGMQFYTGNFLEGKVPRDVGKGGKVYNTHTGFCLEPQHFPDSINKPHWPTTVLKKGERYAGRIVYKFGVEA